MSGLGIFGVVVFFLLLAFGINWLLVKGIIWVALELFKIDWTNKFWVVFVGLLIIQSILSGIKATYKK